MSSAGANLDLLRLLVIREVRVRYARAALGVSWAVFQPLIYLAVFVGMGAGNLLPRESAFGAVPYELFAFSGLVFWLHFQQSVVTGTSSIAIAHDILHKSRFPAELIPLARVFAWFLDLGIGFLLLMGLVALSPHVEFHATTLLVPVVFALQLAFTVGLAFLLSALNLFFRDVHYMLQAFMPVLLFASNVVAPLDLAGERAARIFSLNPMVSYLDAYRFLLFKGELPALENLEAGLWGAVVAPLVGWLYFRRVRPRFAEEV